MAKLRNFLFLLFSLSFLFCNAGAGEPLKTTPTVVIVTIDGVRWNATDGIEAFSGIEKNGFRVRKMRSVFPSQTCPSHASIATGVNPGTHGIVSNQFLEKDSRSRFSHEQEARWLEAPPLWVLAQNAGLKAAVSEWPVSAGPWKGVSPSEYREYDRKNKDRDTIRWVISLLRRKVNRPDLIMAWMRACDGAGHGKGPESEEYRDAAMRTGALIEKLSEEIRKAGLKKNTCLLISSDHGMRSVAGEIDIVPAIPKQGFFPYIAVSGPVAMVYTEDAGQHSAAIDGLKEMGKGLEIYSFPDIPAELALGNSPRVGDIVTIAPPGFIFSPFKRGSHDRNKGYHGWPPSDPDMCGVFLAEGPGVPVKVVEEASVLDIAPTALKILGIEQPSRMEGKPLF